MEHQDNFSRRRLLTQLFKTDLPVDQTVYFSHGIAKPFEGGSEKLPMTFSLSVTDKIPLLFAEESGSNFPTYLYPSSIMLRHAARFPLFFKS